MHNVSTYIYIYHLWSLSFCSTFPWFMLVDAEEIIPKYTHVADDLLALSNNRFV